METCVDYVCDLTPTVPASCCTVGSSNSVFVSNGRTALCGDEIQLLQNTVWFYGYTLLKIESDLNLSVILFSLPLTETTLPLHKNILPHLHCSRVSGLSYRSRRPVGCDYDCSLYWSHRMWSHLSWKHFIYRPCKVRQDWRNVSYREGWRVRDFNEENSIPLLLIIQNMQVQLDVI